MRHEIKSEDKNLKISMQRENIRTIGLCTTVLNKHLNDNNTQTLIREIDGKEHEFRAVKDEHPETWQ